MGNLRDDLDRFLRTDGIRILMDSDGIRTEPYDPLTEDNIDDFSSMNLEELGTDSLEDLLEKAEDLLDDLESDELDDDESEDHSLWEDRISETEDFIDRIRNRISELEDEADGTVTEHYVWKRNSPETPGQQ